MKMNGEVSSIHAVKSFLTQFTNINFYRIDLQLDLKLNGFGAKKYPVQIKTVQLWVYCYVLPGKFKQDTLSSRSFVIY